MTNEKTKNLLLFFVENIKDLRITKAMKLFFYCDFIAFEKYGKSITGLDYHSWDQGPVPPIIHRKLSKDKMEVVSLERRGSSLFVKANPGYKCDISVFDENEKDVIEEVMKERRKLDGSELSKISHDELPWAKTELYGKISYQWAPLQRIVTSSGIYPEDENIILDVINRNPNLHHLYEFGLEDWPRLIEENELEDLVSSSELTPIQWEKDIGWVQGH